MYALDTCEPSTMPSAMSHLSTQTQQRTPVELPLPVVELPPLSAFDVLQGLDAMQGFTTFPLSQSVVQAPFVPQAPLVPLSESLFRSQRREYSGAGPAGPAPGPGPRPQSPATSEDADPTSNLSSLERKRICNRDAQRRFRARRRVRLICRSS